MSITSLGRCLRAALNPLLIAVIVAALLASSANAQGSTPDSIIERWKGETRTHWVDDYTTYTIERVWVSTIQIEVDNLGKVHGTIRQTHLLSDWRQKPGKCWFSLTPPTYPIEYRDCYVVNRVEQPNAEATLKGERRVGSDGRPYLWLEADQNVKQWSNYHLQHHLVCNLAGGWCAPSSGEWTSQSNVAGQGVVGRWNITPATAGRSPLAVMRHRSTSQGTYFTSILEIDGYLVGATDEPVLDLDIELLEQSIFLDQVSVQNNYEATIGWNTPASDNSGTVIWQMGSAMPQSEQLVNKNRSSNQQNMGSQGTGRRPLHVQAKNSLGKESQPQTTLVTVAPPPASAGSPANVTAQKQGASVAYSWSYKFPDPPMTAKVTIPNWFPIGGGKEIGLEETQASVKTEVKATGEGATEGSGQTGFALGEGKKLVGSVNVRGSTQMTPTGAVTESAYEVKLTGKIEEEYPLLQFIPALAPAVAGLSNVCPSCAAVLLDRAKVKAEMSPSVGGSLNYKEEGQNGATFERGELPVSLGLGLSATLKLIEGLLEGSVGVGGEAAATYQAPKSGPLGYLKEIGFKILASAQLSVFPWGLSCEKSWSWAYPGSVGAASAPHDSACTPVWSLLDRSYLLAADYGEWAEGGVKAASASALVDDRLLVENLYPQAKPSLAVSSGKRLLVWAYDKPGSPALSGQEIVYSWTNGDGPGCAGCPTDWQAAQPVTNDNLADFAPHATFIDDGSAVAVWQRFDSSDPGDFNTDPAAYLRHAQVAAARWNAADKTWTAPRQLSAGGALNARPQLAALSDGALAVWVSNPAGYLMGDAAHPDSIQFARYRLTNDAWTPAAAVISPLSGLLDLTLAANGAQAALVYTLDADGDLSTTGDRELYYTRWLNNAWSATTRLTTNTLSDDAPALALDGAGNPLLVWRRGEGLVFLQSNWNAAPAPLGLAESDANQSTQIQIARSSSGDLALVWPEVHNEGASVGYALYHSASGQWGTPRIYAPPDEGLPSDQNWLMAHISPALAPAGSATTQVRSRLLIGYQAASLAYGTQTLDGVEVPNVPERGAFELRAADIPLGLNLSLSTQDLVVMPDTATPGEPATLTATVRNRGDLPAGGVQVTLKSWPSADANAAPTVLGAQTVGVIPAGSSQDLSFNFASPVEGGQVLAVCIDGNDAKQGCTALHTLKELDEGDNLALVRAPLKVRTLPGQFVSGAAIVQAQIEQSGPVYESGHFTATLHLDDIAAAPIAVVDYAFPTAPVAVITATATLSATQLGIGRHTLYWNIDPLSLRGGADRPDHVAGTIVTVLPDLHAAADLMGFNREPGQTAAFVAMVENVGNWQSADSIVAVYDRAPDLAGARKLLELSLPGMEAGSFVEITGNLNLAGTSMAATGLKAIFVVVDPGDELAELNENNNVAFVGSLAEAPGATQSIFMPALRR